MNVITVEDVSVRFSLPQERIVSLKEFAIRRIQRRLIFRELWALRRLSLAVEEGEAVGIIGRNGAGKSTLLRLIARVLRPTEGRIRVVGRVAPLLDLGAGLHPELTGRENVYLNGTLLGHARSEIAARFEDIIEFAELTDFVDAPLRTYSAGMAARLGFAVTTAWRPDVLLVDEALSVGDEKFRAKCEERIAGFRSTGSSIVLVSHDLTLLKAVCQRAVWLERGVVRLAGRVDEVANAYHSAA